MTDPHPDDRSGDIAFLSLDDLLSSMRGGEFKPCAYYHERLDNLYIHLKDCSYTTIRVAEGIEIHRENTPDGDGEIVGLTLECPKRFFK